MANDTTDTAPAHTDQRATYDRFISMSKWGVILVAITLILMAIFLA